MRAHLLEGDALERVEVLVAHGGHRVEATALAELGEPTFERAAQILQSFLELHSSAQLLSAEGAEAMAAVVEWMRNYVP